MLHTCSSECCVFSNVLEKKNLIKVKKYNFSIQNFLEPGQATTGHVRAVFMLSAIGEFFIKNLLNRKSRTPE